MIRSFGSVTGLTNQPQGLDVGLGAGSFIKSLQSGLGTIAAATTSITATVSTVDPTKCILRVSFAPGSSGSADCIGAVITNGTTLTFTRGAAVGSPSSFEWDLTEFNNVKSRQSGTKAQTAATDTVTISSINLQKYYLYVSMSSTAGSTSSTSMTFQYRMIDAQTIQFTAGIASGHTYYWQLLEFN